jgi:hypothetical protein
MYYLKSNATGQWFKGEALRGAVTKASEVFLEEERFELHKEYHYTRKVGQYILSENKLGRLFKDITLWELKAIREIIWTP